jgi:serine phosphatase RsbU (regulator of sigma subunit)
VFQGDDEFGTERLVDAFVANPSWQAPQILESLWETLASFSMNAPQVDDMTALVICHLDSLQQELAKP